MTEAAQDQIRVTLPDGSVREVASGTAIVDVGVSVEDMTWDDDAIRQLQNQPDGEAREPFCRRTKDGMLVKKQCLD